MIIMSRLSDSQQKKKRTCWIVDFPVPKDYRVKIKEIKKRDEYLDLAREQKKKQTMKHKGKGDTKLWLVHLGQSPKDC